MKVASAMTRRVVTVELDDTLAQVKQIFDNIRFHHLLVIERDKLLGVLSDRDLFKAISPNVGTINATTHDEATLNKRVHQVMSRHPVTVHEDDALGIAVDRFLQHDISCLPVVDDAGSAVGVLSWRDILRVMDRQASV